MTEKVRCVNIHNPSNKRHFNINVTKSPHFKKNWKIADPNYALDQELMDMKPEKPRDIKTELQVKRNQERAEAQKLEQIPFNAIKKEEIITKLRESKIPFDPKANKGKLYGLLYPQVKEDSQKTVNKVNEVLADKVEPVKENKEPEIKEQPKEEKIPYDDITKKELSERLKEKGIEHDITSKKIVLYNLLFGE